MFHSGCHGHMRAGATCSNMDLAYFDARPFLALRHFPNTEGPRSYSLSKSTMWVCVSIIHIATQNALKWSVLIMDTM